MRWAFPLVECQSYYGGFLDRNQSGLYQIWYQKGNSVQWRYFKSSFVHYHDGGGKNTQLDCEFRSECIEIIIYSSGERSEVHGMPLSYIPVIMILRTSLAKSWLAWRVARLPFILLVGYLRALLHQNQSANLSFIKACGKTIWYYFIFRPFQRTIKWIIPKVNEESQIHYIILSFRIILVELYEKFRILSIDRRRHYINIRNLDGFQNNNSIFTMAHEHIVRS